MRAKTPLRQRQAERRVTFHRQRIGAAKSPEEQYAAAYAWHLAETRNLPADVRQQELWETAQVLVDRAVALMGRTGR